MQLKFFWHQSTGNSQEWGKSIFKIEFWRKSFPLNITIKGNKRWKKVIRAAGNCYNFLPNCQIYLGIFSNETLKCELCNYAIISELFLRMKLCFQPWSATPMPAPLPTIPLRRTVVPPSTNGRHGGYVHAAKTCQHGEMAWWWWYFSCPYVASRITYGVLQMLLPEVLMECSI